MKTRIISSLIMVPLLGLVLLGGVPLFIAVAVISLIAMHEFYKGFENMNIHPMRIPGYIFGAMLLGIIAVFLFSDADTAKLSEGLLLWVFVTTAGGLSLSLFMKNHDIVDSLVTIIGVIYLPFFFMHVSLIAQLPESAKMIWLVFITAFGTDIFAYFAGVSIGGIIGSTVISGLFGQLVFPQHLAGCIVMGFLGSFFAQCGDLIASSFKRKMGIKDYGNLIPGHGGILDRFDSVVLTAPFIYYYVVLFINR